MKKSIPLFIIPSIITLILLVSCAKDSFFIKGTEDYYENGALSKGKLMNDSIIDGFPVKSWIYFYENGKIKQFELSEDYSISHINFPKGTTVFLNDKGIMVQVYLSQDIKLQNFTCPGGNLKEACGFYPSGKIRFFFPKEDLYIDNIPCKGGGLHGVWLYESGHLKKAYLSKKYTMGEKTFKKGEEIMLDDK